LAVGGWQSAVGTYKNNSAGRRHPSRGWEEVAAIFDSVKKDVWIRPGMAPPLFREAKQLCFRDVRSLGKAGCRPAGGTDWGQDLTPSV